MYVYLTTRPNKRVQYGDQIKKNVFNLKSTLVYIAERNRFLIKSIFKCIYFLSLLFKDVKQPEFNKLLHVF